MRAYPVYLKLVGQWASRFGVHQDDADALFASIPPMERLQRPKGPVTFRLTVEDEFSISRQEKGRVLELVGPNARNKTTTLVYTAVILGSDIEAQAPFLDDHEMVDQALDIQDLLSGGQHARLLLEDDRYRLDCSIADGAGSVTLWNKETQAYRNIDRMSLKTAEDWAGYRRWMAELVDVQLVAKGRNFVVQVGLEEAQNLVQLCQTISQRIQERSNWLMTQRPVRSQADLELDIKKEEGKVQSLQRQLATEEKGLGVLRNMLLGTEETYQLYQSLFQHHSLSEAISLRRKLADAQAALASLTEAEAHVLQLSERTDQVAAEAAGLEAALGKFDGALEELTIVFQSERPRLGRSADAVATLLNAITDKDIDRILSILDEFALDSDSVAAYHTLDAESTWAGVSRQTRLLSADFAGISVRTVGQLREAASTLAKCLAERLTILEPVNRFIGFVSELGFQSTAELREAQIALEEMRQFLSGNALLQAENARLKCKHSFNSTLSPYATLDALTEATEKAANEIPLQIREQMEALQLQELFCGPWGPELDARVSAELVTLSSKVMHAERQVAGVRKMLQSSQGHLQRLRTQLQNAGKGYEVDARIDHLADLQQHVSLVEDYFALRTEYERTLQDNVREQLDRSKDLLGTTFTEVMEALNQRIMCRCPSAFVNLDTLKREPILWYDFESGEFKIKGAPRRMEKHGGLRSSVTVYGLASKESTTEFGSILLVDEFGDAGVYKEPIFKALAEELPDLRLALFVDVDEAMKETELKVRC